MVINLPLPSARKWTLVLNPPWLRPNASVAGSPFLHQRHAGAHAQPCHRHNERPSPVHRRRPPPAAPQQTRCPRCPLAANAGSGCTPLTTNHTAPAGLATVLPSPAPTKCRSICAGDLLPVALSVPSAPAAAASASPTARLLAHVVVPCSPVYTISQVCIHNLERSAKIYAP